MKKFNLALILVLLFILSISVSAKAGYIPGENIYVSADTNDAETVIIYKGENVSGITSESIYYVDQCEEAEGFSDLKMGLKFDAPAGVYTVATNKVTTTFEISDAQASVSGAVKLEFLGAEKKGNSSYSAGFGINVSNLLAEGLKLTMVIGNKAYKTELFGPESIVNWGSGETYIDEAGRFMFAIQIDGIGADYFTNEDGALVPNFELYVK